MKYQRLHSNVFGEYFRRQFRPFLSQRLGHCFVVSIFTGRSKLNAVDIPGKFRYVIELNVSLGWAGGIFSRDSTIRGSYIRSIDFVARRDV